MQTTVPIGLSASALRHRVRVIGTHEAKQALMTDQQLADRFEARELPAWRDDPPCQQLLASFAAILPLREASDLHHPKIQKRVLSLSDGVMIRMCRLLEAAAIEALELLNNSAIQTWRP
jgi:TniB protein